MLSVLASSYGNWRAGLAASFLELTPSWADT